MYKNLYGMCKITNKVVSTEIFTRIINY